MNAEIKSTLFTAFLVVTNWHWNRAVENSRTHSNTTLNLDGAAIGVLICIVGLIVFSRRLYRLVRHLLDRGVRVPAEGKFVSRAPMILLLFLLVQYSGTFTKTSGNATITTTFGYGSAASGVLILLAVLLISVYQFYCGLKANAEP